MRRILMAAVLASGCAAQMTTTGQKLSLKSGEPDCDDSYGYVAGDLLVSGVGDAIWIVGSQANEKILVAAGVLTSATFLISALISGSQAADCRKAKETWRTTQLPSAQPIVVNVQQPTAPPPRGFFCSYSDSSVTANMCAREKSTCEQARAMAIAAVPDLTACTLVEKAWCVGDKCFATESACNAQRGDAACEVR